MKLHVQKKLGIIIPLLLLFFKTNAQNPGLAISEILANPAGTDSPFEYVELVATKSITFSATPYCVVLCNNGTATTAGWIAGGAISYGFNITSGTVNAGDVVYVGGSSMTITGTKLRMINTATTGGDSFGSAASAGVVGNGGSNADGVAIFAADISTITNSTIPVDAIFYGASMGSAIVSAGTAGYQLPTNDKYSGGKLQSTSFTAPDPASADIIKATGTFNLTSNTWSTPRSFVTTTLTTDGNTSISLVTSDVTTPTVLNAYLQNNTTIKVKFSEPVSASTATLTSNYNLNPVVAINTISLSTSADTATLYLSSPLTIGITHTLSISGIADLASNTMTMTQNFPLLNTGITVKSYTWKNPGTIGTFQGLNIPNGGFSGLNYIKGSSNEFYVVTDRGPNLDANNNNHALAIGGANNTAKLFAIPAFNPNVMHFKAQGDSLILMSTITLKRPDNTATSGLTNPIQTGGTGEIALTDTNGTIAGSDIWGIDSEGLTDGNDNDFWIPEEYGVSIWHTTNDGKVINRYAPYGAQANAQSQDIGIDTIFKFRNPNKGFEGVAFTPNKKVYGFIQNTILFPASDANLKKNTRLHRFVEIDTRTNITRMLAYQHDAVGSGTLSSVKNDKRYIGDAIAVNDHEVLVLEHGKSSTESYGKVYLVDLSTGTPINPTNHMAYAGGTKSFEQLLDSTTAASNGVSVVKKTLLIDLVANGYAPNIEKKEGLTIINDTCIAIANDNDFGIVANNADGVASYNNVKSKIYIFSFPRSKKLNLCNNITISASSLSICPGDSVLLSTASTTGLNYQWKLNDNIITGATNSSLYAKVNGNYELFGTNSNSCTAISNTKQITVLPTPTISINTSTTAICQGDTLLINLSGATSYTWSTGSHSQSFTIAPSTSTTYTAEGTDVNGCKNSSTLSLQVNTPPTLTITATNTIICNGESTSLNVTGANSYTWTNGPASSNYSVTPSASIVYTVVGTDNAGCKAEEEISITVNAIPTLTTNSSASVICAGEASTLTVTGATNYTWSPNNEMSSAIVVNPSTNATYTVTGENNGCFDEEIISLTVNQLPAVSVMSSHTMICTGESAVLTASTTATSYSWSEGSTTMTISVSPTITSTYSVMVDDGNCTNTASITQSVSMCTGIDEATIALNTVIYPNPFNTLLMIKNENKITSSIKSSSVKVYNTLGETILTMVTNQDEITIETASWKNGIYFIQIDNKTYKVLKQE